MVSPSRWLRHWRQAKGPARWVGLDLGSSSIKLAEVESSAAGVRLLTHVLQELPSTPTPGSKERLSWLQAVLKEAKASDVHLTIGGPDVLSRCVTVPPMSQEELAEAVKWQVKDELPFPVKDAVLDFEVLGQVWDKDIKKLDVLVAAAPLSVVQEQITLAQQAGVKVMSLVPTVLALCRTVQQLSPERLKGSVAVVEMGAKQTHVVLLKDGHPRLSRDVSMGSADITQALVGVSALDAAKAEQLKRQHGILSASAEGVTEDGIPLAQLGALMRVVLEKLSTELARICDFYTMQMGEAGIERILLVGGGASLKHLATFLSETLALAVEPYNPLPHLARPSPPAAASELLEEGARLTAAIGAALAHGQPPDLMPAQLKARRRQAVIQRRVKTVATAAGTVALGLYVILQGIAWGYGRVLRATERDWQAFEPPYHHYLDLTQQARRLEGIMATVQGFVNQQPLWAGIFKELSQLTPAGVTLTELTVTTSQDPGSPSMRLLFRGRVGLGASGSEGDLGRLLQALEASVFFRGVKLQSSQVQVGLGRSTTFEIGCDLE